MLTDLAVNTALLLGSAAGYWNWRRAANNVVSAQNSLLQRILRRNADTCFGREHRFGDTTSATQYQQAVPLRTYSDFEPYIRRTAQGENNVLTAEPVLMFEPSSGSTSATKLIPYTATLKSQFQNGIAPWLFSLYASRPGLLRGKHYWSITPAGSELPRTSGGIAVGFEEDSEYFGLIRRWLVRSLLAVPPGVRRISEVSSFRYVTLRFLLQCPQLSLISVWNPTFLLLLLADLTQYGPFLLEDLTTGCLNPPVPLVPEVAAELEPFLARDPARAGRLSGLLDSWTGEPDWRNHQGHTVYEAIWPQLQLLSCWADGPSGEYADRLQQMFPNVPLKPKGLVATEGLVSFPVGNRIGAALALTAHFFEFIEAHRVSSGNIPHLAHQLEMGKTYSVIITTGGGLYRYRLKDLVEVIGFIGGCPLVRFLGKEDAVVDLFGEKLNDFHVRSVVSTLLATSRLKCSFWLIAPEKDGAHTAHYTFYIQCTEPSEEAGALRELNSGIESALCDNYHYQYCRRLGQLSPLRLYIIEPDYDAASAFLRKCHSLGQRLGDVKATGLHSYLGWYGVFPGRYISA